jgi:hypothetical protein
MMIVCVYHMLKSGEGFSPSDYEDFQNPAPKKQVLNEQNAIKFLLEQGYDVSGLAKAM